MPDLPERLNNSNGKGSGKRRYPHLYNYRWEQQRKRFLRMHPICECDECTDTRRLWTANVVHHITDHEGDRELFWDRNNWQALNKTCHDKLSLAKANHIKRKSW